MKRCERRDVLCGGEGITRAWGHPGWREAEGSLFVNAYGSERRVSGGYIIEPQNLSPESRFLWLDSTPERFQVLSKLSDCLQNQYSNI